CILELHRKPPRRLAGAGASAPRPEPAPPHRRPQGRQGGTAMTVRRAEKKDTPRIQQLLWQVEQVHHRIRPDLFRDGGRKYTDAQLADILADDARPVLAAVDENDRLLGYAFCKFVEYRDDNIMQDRRTLYLDDLCVDETLRGQ